MGDHNNGTRSFSTEVVGGDSFSLTLNFKFLIQMFMVFGSIIFGYVQLQERLNNLERDLADATEQLEKLVQDHIEENEKEYLELTQELEWYKKEINLNPLSWGKKKGKK